MQAAVWGSAGSTTNILPPSAETADACRWDMVHGVGRSISGDGNEGTQKEESCAASQFFVQTFITNIHEE